MKKVLLALFAAALFIACTDDTKEDIDLYGPDKTTCPPGGCPQ